MDVAQDVIVREDDCGTDRGILVTALIDGTEIIEPLDDRLIGRYARKTVRHPETKEVIVPENGLFTEELAVEIMKA